jgi:hypothetical protein
VLLGVITKSPKPATMETIDPKVASSFLPNLARSHSSPEPIPLKILVRIPSTYSPFFSS